MNQVVIQKVARERPATRADVEELLHRIPWLRDVFPGEKLHERVEASLQEVRRRN